MQKKIAATLIGEALALVDETVADSHITNVQHNSIDDSLLVEGVDETDGPYSLTLVVTAGRWKTP